MSFFFHCVGGLMMLASLWFYFKVFRFGIKRIPVKYSEWDLSIGFVGTAICWLHIFGLFDANGVERPMLFGASCILGAHTPLILIAGLFESENLDRVWRRMTDWM